MAQLTDVLEVYDFAKTQVVARVVLNGYNINSTGPIGKQGSLRSFSISEGNLWDPWSRQELLVLHDENGREASIKVAALPADEEGFGLIEFL